MKILSEEDGDTIMNDHFEEDEPMNTNIDKRLQEILDKLILDSMNASSSADINPTETLAAIHAAYKAAGYRHNFAAQVFDHEVDKKIKLLGLMTGAEWLERFIFEYKHFPSFGKGFAHTEDAIKAARAASGIEEPPK